MKSVARFISLESLTALFESLCVSYTSVSHPEADSFATWIKYIESFKPQNIPASAPTKSLVLKPKGDKPPVLVVSLESTPYSISSLSKLLGLKDARVAQDDLVQSTFGISKLDLTPFAYYNVQDKSSIQVVVDQNIFADPQRYLAFRGFSSKDSFYVKADALKSFLDSCGEYNVVDFAPKEEKKKAETGEKEVLIGLTAKKDQDFPNWYSQVLLRTEMLDYYDISGCYIIRPWAYSIWKKIQQFFGSQIEEMGVEDCYFPMFVSERSLNREKDHIEGFSPEVAWVTRAGQSDLAEPIAVRPTSETVMYPYYASWIQSHRDLPLRLNQWCNVVRWEFKHPQPFLRTREFLWQEGHTAFATKEESDVEVREILDLYRRVYEELLAVPVVPGKKSEKEKFAGGLYTTTVEGFIPTTGRAIQGATSHCLGQNFSKMFEIMVHSENRDRVHVWQNSWGITTRTIGVMVMVHGDDKGLVLPPRVASIQVIVIPVGITAKTSTENRQVLYQKASEIADSLKKAGIRAKADLRENYTPGFKYNDWELRGVPIRLEVGPRDLEKNQVRCVKRHDAKSEQLSVAGLETQIQNLLETIQNEMFTKAKQERDSRLVKLETWDKFVETLNNKCIVLAPWCEETSCEEAVKERSAKSDQPQDEKAPSMGAKTLCIPFEQPELKQGQQCFACDRKAKSYTLWGRSY